MTNNNNNSSMGLEISSTEKNIFCSIDFIDMAI